MEGRFARGRIKRLKRLPSEIVEATAEAVDGLVGGAAVQLNGCCGGGLRCGNLRSRRLRGGRDSLNRICSHGADCVLEIQRSDAGAGASCA